MGELLIAVALLWFLKLEKPMEWNWYGSSSLPRPSFQIANDIRHVIKNYTQTIPTVLEIPSKDHP